MIVCFDVLMIVCFDVLMIVCFDVFDDRCFDVLMIVCFDDRFDDLAEPRQQKCEVGIALT